MKLRSLMLVGGLSLLSSAYATNYHQHLPVEATKAPMLSSSQKSMIPGYCEIEIINNSNDNVTVYGRFDDGSDLRSFNVYKYDAPHYINLYYYNFCHQDMYLDIVTFSGYHIYSGYTRAESTIRIVPYLTNQIKALVTAK